MSTVNKKISESIGVKMMNFAEDVFIGMTKPTAKDLAFSYGEKMFKHGAAIGPQGLNSLEKAYEKKLVESSTRLGYKMGDFLGGGIRNSVKDYKAADAAYQAGKTKNKASIIKAIENGHTTIENGKRVINGKAVAGTGVALSVGGRVATGGGLYRDRDGNVNLPGIPFI